jgi:mxaJ protein
MFLPSPKWAIAILLLSTLALQAHARELRVCADPENMPFSNIRREGFENHLAELLADALDAHLTYVWQRMGRGFVREYLGAAKCDLLIGVPANFPPVLTTVPYYRSSYVFVSPSDQQPIDSFDSPRLRGLKIGVQVLDEDFAAPGQALARRGLQNTIVGYDTTGDGAGSIVDAVASKKIDLAIVWGPLAGYFVRQHPHSFQIHPVEPEIDPPGLPFAFDISMAVRKDNNALRDELNAFLTKYSQKIRATLTEYGVPQLPLSSATSAQEVTR